MIITKSLHISRDFSGGSDGKASAYNAGDLGSIPGSGRSPGGNGNPLQYSCLEDSMDGGALQAIVHGVAKSRTRLSNFNVIVNVGILVCKDVHYHKININNSFGIFQTSTICITVKLVSVYLVYFLKLTHLLKYDFSVSSTTWAAMVYLLIILVFTHIKIYLVLSSSQLYTS